MTNQSRKQTPRLVRLSVVTTTTRVEAEFEFDDDEKPSLSPMPAATVYDTTCDEVSQVRGPSVAKCGPVPSTMALSMVGRRR